MSQMPLRKNLLRHWSTVRYIVACPINKFCPEGLATVAAATTCPKGAYCPAGSMEAIPCIAGSHQPGTGQNVCIDCASPFFCPFMLTVGASVTSQKTNCTVGHMCPDAKMQTPIPCDPGYYQNVVGKAVCIACPTGAYCPYQAMAASLPCPDRHYCYGKTITPTLCIDGQWCDSTNVASQKILTRCPAGYFCRSGKRYPC